MKKEMKKIIDELIFIGYNIKHKTYWDFNDG